MKYLKFLTVIVLFNLLPINANIIQDFPSHSYVFNELDVDESFIYNKDFQDFVRKNKRKYTKVFIDAVNRGHLIIPTMREIMYQKDISPLFIYLSMVESSFQTEAVSSSSAGGLWQFVKLTALDERLQVDDIVDERYDPVKATNAAVDYLYKIHSSLGKWYLTAMAYNCGAGCVRQSIDKAGTWKLDKLIDPKANYIRKETRDYIKKILLFALIGENYLFKSNDNLGEMKYKFDGDMIVPVRVRGGETLDHIASLLRMNPYNLRRINMHLKRGFVPPTSNIMVNIPVSRMRRFIALYRGKRQMQRQAFNR